jgi:pimeloyl-ACP methyl ester carboxylesterase
MTSPDTQPCLVLIPGLACDHAAWAPVRPALEAHARPWVPEPAAHLHIADMARAVLQQAPAERFALAGHSMGGRVALEMARQAPQRVLRLALLDTGWQPLPAGADGAAEVAQRMALLDLARSSGMRAMGERWSPPMLHPSRWHGAVHADVLAMIERQPLALFEAQQHALINRPDAAAVLDGLGCPTLVLCGEQDSWSPPERHQHMARRVAGAQLVLVPDCGHMSTMEQPRAVAQALVLWLQVRTGTA